MILSQLPGKTSGDTSPPAAAVASPPAMTASASPLTIGSSSTTDSQSTTNTTATPTNGTAAYTYAWAIVTTDGLAAYTISAPTAATTLVSATGIPVNTSCGCTIRCTVTDSLAATAQTESVTASFYRTGPAGSGITGSGGDLLV